MAGEDPGVGTLSVVLELIQRAGSAVTGTIKNTISFGLDVIKTGMFFAWRRQMMQSQKGPQLEHGQQSLRDLRLHEQVGAQIVSVEIGDYKSMDALCQELRRLEIDFAITEHDYQYTLHYKSNNERDVMLAQAMAMQKLYGDPVQETPDDPSPEKDEQDRRQEELERQNQEEQQRQEQERQDQEQQNQQNLNQDWTQDWQPDWEQDQQRQGQSGPEQNEGATASEQVQPEGMDHERGRADQRESIGAAEAGRTAVQPLTVAGAARAVPVDELTQKLQQMADRGQVRGLSEQQTQRVEQVLENLGSANRAEPSLTRSAFERSSPSLDEVKRQAKERARTKNLARKARGRDISQSRAMSRARHRGLELGH